MLVPLHWLARSTPLVPGLPYGWGGKESLVRQRELLYVTCSVIPCRPRRIGPGSGVIGGALFMHHGGSGGSHSKPCISARSGWIEMLEVAVDSPGCRLTYISTGYLCGLTVAISPKKQGLGGQNPDFLSPIFQPPQIVGISKSSPWAKLLGTPR